MPSGLPVSPDHGAPRLGRRRTRKAALTQPLGDGGGGLGDGSGGDGEGGGRCLPWEHPTPEAARGGSRALAGDNLRTRLF